jgi:hypothetical protein
MQAGESSPSQLSVADVKAALATYDQDIIEWMKKDPKYCLRMQQTLDMFVADIFR